MKWLIRLALIVLWLVSLLYAFGFGALANQYAPQTVQTSMARSLKLMELFSGGYRPCADTPVLECGYRDTSDRTEVNCSDYKGKDTAVLMTFGQSNSANAGKDPYYPAGDVANFEHSLLDFSHTMISF